MLDMKNVFKLIMENLSGLIVVDKDMKIQYLDDSVVKYLGLTQKEMWFDKEISTVMRDDYNRLYEVVETGKPRIGELYTYEGTTVVTNGYPLYKNGELIGAFEFDVFENPEFVDSFIKRIKELSTELQCYKNKYKDLRTTKYSVADIIGESDAICSLKSEIRNISRSNSTVLIQGETGSGKELIANAIHSSSKRNLNNFVAINCAAIPSELFESELFGYEEGGFTGAKKGGKVGKIELADNGTIFLDEVDQLPLSSQSKLLRFLQEKEITKVGGVETIPVDVRIISASNKNIKRLVEEGSFREDLYYRLNVVEIVLPPLRERREDIISIALSLIKKLNISMGRDYHFVNGMDENVEKALRTYDWPGNVRELQNVVERAMNNCFEETLHMEHFMGYFGHEGLNESEMMKKGVYSLEKVKDSTEKTAINNALKKSNGNKAMAARLLEVSRETLYQKMRKYEIDEPLRADA